MEASTTQRSLDTARTASADLMALNNTVVNMRNAVKSAKVQVIRKLTKGIRNLKNKKGSEDQREKNLRKAERLLQEIYAIKALKADRVSKYALASTSTFEDVCKQASAGAELRSLARLAQHKNLVEKVSTFRSNHLDWPALTSYLLVKQTGRRFKSKKQKAAARHKASTNIIAAKSLTRSYLTSKFGPSPNIENLMVVPKRKGETGVSEQVSVTGNVVTPSVVRQGVKTDKNDSAPYESTDREKHGSVFADALISLENAKSVSRPGELRTKAAPHKSADGNEVNHSAGIGKLHKNSGEYDSEEEDGLEEIDSSSKNGNESSDVDTLKDSKKIAAHFADTSEEEVGSESGGSDADSDDDGDRNELTQNTVTKLVRLKGSVSETGGKKETQKPTDRKKEEMVVKVLDLKAEDTDEIMLTKEIESDAAADILIRQPESLSKLAEDPFFLCGEDDPANDGDTSDGEEGDGMPQDNDKERTDLGKHANKSVFISLGYGNRNQNKNSWERRGRGLVRGIPQQKQFGFQSRREKFGGRDHSHHGEGGTSKGCFRGRASGRFRGQRQDSRHSREFAPHRRNHDATKQHSFEHKTRGGFKAPSTQGGKRTAQHTVNKKEKMETAEKVHPSWEASRKRKEQQNVSFQGKRTKFDDD